MKFSNKPVASLLIIVFTSVITIGQDYKLVVSSQAYENIENPTIITQDDYDLDTAYQVILPFDFEVLDKKSNTIWVTSNGNIAIGEDYDETDYIAINAYHIALQSFLIDATVSPISLEVSGVEGQRIAKVEWKMSYFRALEGLFDYLNMQVWMYEGENKIELHYGKSSLELITHQFEVEDSLGHFGGIVGIAHNTNTSYEGTNLTADSTMPTIVNLIERNPSTIPPFRLGFPNDSTVYELTRVTTNVSINKTLKSIAVRYLPNGQEIIINNYNPIVKLPYQIISSSGQIVLSGNMVGTTKSVNVSNLISGIYFLHIDKKGLTDSNWKFNIQN